MSLPHAVGEEEPTLPIRRVSTVPPPEHGTIVFDLTRSMEWLRRAGGAMGGASSSFVESPVLTETLLHGSHTSHASGTFMGVFVPCTCTIFGVVVFLRLGVVVGQAGIWCTLLVLLFAFGLTLLTTLSICALISDGTDIASSAPIGKGATDPGVYAALRKSVGKSLGTALGAAFYLAFMTNVAFYIVGFAETMRQALRAHSFDTVFVLPELQILCARGVHFSSRISLLTLGTILGCILISLGCLLLPTYDDESGHTVLSSDTWAANEWPVFSNTTVFPSLKGEPPSVVLM
ncbi:MAG: hypothetical protein SGPRY_005346, partial [Prymnesium sp.]